MARIHDIPPEIIRHIFRLGCEDHPKSLIRKSSPTPKIPKARRLRHPFIVTIAPICAQWNEIASQGPSQFYFTYVKLQYEEAKYDNYATDAFVLTLAEYYRGLKQSNGSDLYIVWSACRSKVRDNLSSSTIELFLHAMRLSLEYRPQIRYIKAFLCVSEVLAYFMLLQSHFYPVEFLHWRIAFMAHDWPTFLSDVPSSVYLEDGTRCVSTIVQRRTEVSPTVFASGVLCSSSVQKSVEYLAFTGDSMTRETFRSILFCCSNVSRLRFRGGGFLAIGNSPTPDISTRLIPSEFTSVTTLLFDDVLSQQVSNLFSSFQFPNLQLVKVESGPQVRESELTTSVKVLLPGSVTDVVCGLFGDHMSPAFMFYGTPITPLEKTRGGNSEEGFSCVMMSFDHRWRLTVQWQYYNNIHGTQAAIDFLKAYEDGYREVLERSHDGLWVRKMKELRAEMEEMRGSSRWQRPKSSSSSTI